MMVALTRVRTFAVEKHARMHAYTLTINTLVNLGGVQMFNSQQDVIPSIPSLFSLSLSLSLFLPLSIYLSLSLYLSLTSLLTSNLSLGASALACMFFLPSVPHSFLPSFTPLLLPPLLPSIIPSFSGIALFAPCPRPSIGHRCSSHVASVIVSCT